MKIFRFGVALCLPFLASIAASASGSAPVPSVDALFCLGFSRADFKTVDQLVEIGMKKEAAILKLATAEELKTMADASDSRSRVTSEGFGEALDREHRALCAIVERARVAGILPQGEPCTPKSDDFAALKIAGPAARKQKDSSVLGAQLFFANLGDSSGWPYFYISVSRQTDGTAEEEDMASVTVTDRITIHPPSRDPSMQTPKGRAIIEQMNAEHSFIPIFDLELSKGIYSLRSRLITRIAYLQPSLEGFEQEAADLRALDEYSCGK